MISIENLFHLFLLEELIHIGFKFLHKDFQGLGLLIDSDLHCLQLLRGSF